MQFGTRHSKIDFSLDDLPNLEPIKSIDNRDLLSSLTQLYKVLDSK